MLGTRIKAAWAVLRGRTYLPPVPQAVYVKDGGSPYRWVQLVTFQDRILALNAVGTVYELRLEYSGYVCQLVMESPTRY